MGLSANQSNRLYIESARRAYNRWLITEHTKGEPHVRKRNRKGSDRRLRRRRRHRFARDFLVDPNGRVAVSGVWAGADLLRYVLGRLLLVDGVRAGPRPVGAMRGSRRARQRRKGGSRRAEVSR